MHPTGLDVVSVEPADGKGAEELSLAGEPLDRSNAGRAVCPGVHALIDPQPRSLVELRDRGRQTGDDELFEERLLQISERPLDLALAFRVTGLTRIFQ